MPSEPWESWAVFAYNSVVNVKPGEYRFYYDCIEGTGTPPGGKDATAPESKVGAISHRRICLATSSDGVVWTKPSLGIFNLNGSTANNILLEDSGVSVSEPMWPQPCMLESRLENYWGERVQRCASPLRIVPTVLGAPIIILAFNSAVPCHCDTAPGVECKACSISPLDGISVEEPTSLLSGFAHTCVLIGWSVVWLPHTSGGWVHGGWLHGRCVGV
jgi:hypothetical protein